MQQYCRLPCASLDQSTHCWKLPVRVQCDCMPFRDWLNSGDLGAPTLAKLSRAGILEGYSLAPASYVQARQAQVCDPCMIGKMRRTSHLSCPSQKVQVLHCVHMDLCELAPGSYFSTMIDEATRFARVGIFHRKSDTAAEVRTQVVWCETKTGKACTACAT
jgi:hypothetical protein